MNLRSLFFALLLFVALSCDKTPYVKDDSGTQRGKLVAYKYRGTIPAEKVVLWASLDGESRPLPQDYTHDVDVYTITYQTDYRGSAVLSDALVSVPRVSQALQNNVSPIHLCAFFKKTNIPYGIVDVVAKEDYKSWLITDFELNEIRRQMPSTREYGQIAFGAAGYGFAATVIPEYIGYSRTKDLQHPYTCYVELSKACVDALLATKQLLSRLEVDFESKVYLTGRSQGAGTSMFMHRLLQERYSDEFEVLASTHFCGPYSMKSFFDSIYNEPQKEFSALKYPLYTWSLYCLNLFTPSLQRPTDQVFTYPVNDQFDVINPPSRSAATTIQAKCIESFLNGTDTAFLETVKANSTDSDWSPKGTVYMFHGEQDSLVPYFNAVNALAGLTVPGSVATVTDLEHIDYGKQSVQKGLSACGGEVYLITNLDADHCKGPYELPTVALLWDLYQSGR